MKKEIQFGWRFELTALLVAVCLALGGTPAAADSGGDEDASLLDILHGNETLTDEQYRQLLAEEKETAKVLRALKGLDVGALAYVDFSGGEKDNESYNRFAVTRGYVNVKRQLTPWLGFRVTPDVHQDDHGDYKLRLKYLYAAFSPPDLGFLTDMVSEVGIGHMPWLDFEEHINPYRCQGTMSIERAKTFNSADVGVSLGGNLGGTLDKAWQKKVSKYYPGKWGSWHVGVYNGGGYHAVEENDNKIPQVRVTLRPLPGVIPGLQVSYFGLFGEGNRYIDDGAPKYRVNLVMVSYQNAWVTFTGQYACTLGNNTGNLVEPGTSDALKAGGYSIFFNTKLPLLERKLNLFARYDRFDPDVDDRLTPGDDNYDLVFGGLAWEFFHHWYLMVVYETIEYEKNNGGLGKLPGIDNCHPDDWKVQTVLQIKFS